MQFHTYIFIALALLLLALAVFDAISTTQAIKRGAHEANIFMAWLMRVLPKGWVYVRIGFALAVIGAAAYSPYPGSIMLLVAACALWAYAVKNNFDIAWNK
jgi:hypothetical protein